ncbi:MAG: TetR/AcrR family transcriptional regulator [Chitinophagales bacterium]
MTNSKLLPELAKTDKKAAIMEAALELFATQGFHSTSISQVAKKAGISKGSIYTYFDSKQALLEGIVFNAVDMGEEYMEEFFNEPTPEDALRKVIETNMMIMVSQKQYMGFMTSLMLQPDAYNSVKEKLAERSRKSIKKMEEVFTQKGSANPKIETRIFLATLDGIGIHYLAEYEDYPLEDIKASLIERYC